MDDYKFNVQIRWSDLDPNFHLRHSVYYDWGALCRIEFLNAHGLTPAVMQQLQFGPILFREECVFKKEIRSGDPVWMDLHLVKAKKDFSRWSIRHNIWKKEGILSAVLTVEGAWMDVVARKLAAPPVQVHDAFQAMTKADTFEWV